MAEDLNELEEAKRWFIEQVRIAMIDDEDLNELIGREEVGDEEIKHAINRTIDEYNTTPPPLNTVRTYKDFPSKDLLIVGTMANLLLHGSILHFRNELNYNAGGISVQTHDKGQAYLALANRLKQEFTQRTTDKKISENASTLLMNCPGVGSDYGLLNWYWNSLNPGSTF